MKSKSEEFLENRNRPPLITPNMYKNVSDYRKATLENEVNNGLFRDGNSDLTSKNTKQTSASNVISSSAGIKKDAQATTSNAFGSGWRGSGGSVRQTPEVYSPLWLNSNLNLPRDRATINAWCRSFYALNPIVQNAINLHSTYPISKLNIRCPNKKIERHFNEMIEETDLINICIQVAQEYWLLGESFVYGELSEDSRKWERFVVQNPDYITIQKSPIASEPIISLRPDENLRRIVFSNKSNDIAQRNQLNPNIIEHIKSGRNIPLDNFFVSHLARKPAPYEVRGTGLPVCVFRQLMLFDKLRECYSEDTEVLTDQGFKKISDLVYKTSSININKNYVNGVELDPNGQVESILTMKENFTVACFNPENKNIEYHKPVELHMSKYTGKMINFKSRNFDTLVSPNHKMFVQKKHKNNDVNSSKDWELIKAQDINPESSYRFRGLAGWQGKDIEFVKVLDKDVPIKLYLEFLGYLISEGCVSKSQTGSPYTLTFTQKITSDCYLDMKNILEEFAKIFDKHVGCNIRNIKQNNFKKQPDPVWNGIINSKDLYEFFKNEIGSNGKCTSHFKKIPRWILELKPELQKLILEKLLLGDGSHIDNKNSKAYRYYTASRQLADDVQEMAFKCGFSPSLHSYLKEGRKSTEYLVSWSTANDGDFPILVQNKKYPPKIHEVDYDGVVWCFEVPTGLFITRRNGKISIHGNSKFAQADGMINPMTLIKVGSADYKPTFTDLEMWRETFEAAQYDKDFKIFTHEAVDVQKIGSGAGIYDISGDVTQLLKEIYIGLMVPQVLMEAGDITYANGGVALDVLRQRYMSFRNMMSAWLKRKVFAPISKINDFYEYSNNEKKLIVPEVEWNHMSLFDASDYINVLVGLSGEKKNVSTQTLYKSLGLEWEEEQRKMRQENIAAVIYEKEQESMKKMSLNELRALGEDDEIPEISETPLPGEGNDQVPSGDDATLPGVGGDMLPPPPPPSV